MDRLSQNCYLKFLEIVMFNLTLRIPLNCGKIVAPSENNLPGHKDPFSGLRHFLQLNAL